MTRKEIIVIGAAVAIALFVFTLFYIFGNETPPPPLSIIGEANGTCGIPGTVFYEDSRLRETITALERVSEEKATCYAAAGSYAFSIPVSKYDSFYCADSTGFAGTISENIKGPSCR